MISVFKKGPTYSWKKVFVILLLSSCPSLVLGGIFFFLPKLHGRYVKEAPLKILVQTGPSFPQLPNEALAEILDLSQDYPVDLLKFNIGAAKERLLASKIIADVELKKIKPNILYIDYSLRKPLALLENFTNTAIDKEGFFFPLSPFFFPKLLPKVYLASGDFSASCLETPYIEIVKNILSLIDAGKIERIDLSQVKENTLGKRELVLVMCSGHILRLSAKKPLEGIKKYLLLEKILLKNQVKKKVIDLRLENIAYLGDFDSY